MRSFKALSRSVQRLFHSRGSAYDPAVQATMRREWDERARENARHYVTTGQERWTDEEFFRSGREWVDWFILPDLPLICGGRDPGELKVLEIGCGAGRMTHALSQIFGMVYGVDVSSEMVAHARTALRDRPNVELQVNNGVDLSMFPDGSMDLAISAIVFQHIPSRSVVENYIVETWRVLKPDSTFKFQVQGGPIEDEDANTWVGVGFSQEQMRDIARRVGFQIRDSSGAGTQYYWLTFHKPPRPERS